MDNSTLHSCNLPEMPISNEKEDKDRAEMNILSHKIDVQVPENLNWSSKEKLLFTCIHF